MRKKKILMMLALLCAIVQGTKAQITFPIVYDDVWDGRTTSVPVYYTEYKGHTNVVVIKKASELAYIRDNWREKATYSENTNPYSNLNYYLDANLDLGDAVSWNPIGNGWLDGLTKTFYGANHTIRINIQHEGEEYAGGGLFSRLGTEGVIQDLHVTGIINVGDWRGIGAIVGENLGKIKNCWVSADVISAHYSASNSAALGGIAGQCYGSSSVEYCCMTGNVSNPKNNGVAGIIGEGYGNANHVTFYGTRYNDHSEHDIWVGDQDGTLTNQHADDLNNDATLTSYLGSFSGNDLYRQAIQYSYAVNIKNIGTGIMTSNLERTRPGQTVRLTKASGNSVASVTVKDADSNPITVSGNEMNGWTFTMPQRDVTVTAAFLNDDGTVPDTGMSIDVWNGSSQARPGYFDASSHTIHIQSAAQLIYVYNNWDNEVFSGYDYYECNYILDTDLDMSTKTWKPLGSKAYKGTFNGNGHMIRIKIDDSSISDNGQGLFATIASGSRVENLHVDGKIKVGNARLVGGIVGDNYGTIRNCWVSANVESSHYSSYDADLGGICGLNESDGTVEFCCMTGNVTNTGDNSGVGGLAGSNDGTIQHCTFYGSVSVNHSQDNKYVGEQDETMEDMYDTYDDVHYGYSNGGGNNMYCYAYKYPYSVTVNTMGTGTIRTSAADEYDVPGTYPDATFTLHVTSGSVARFTITNADGNDVPLQGQANDGSSYWFVMPQKNITATFVFYEDWPTQGTGTEEDPYLISSADDWNKFAHNVTYGRSYSGQYVKLTNDISVTTMAGGYQADDNYQPFSGTFDGDGHTLTLNVNNQSRFAAPFKCVSGATIKNLRTAGTIDGTGNADGKLLAGIVGVSFGNTTISGCVSSVTLTTAFGTDAALAGLVAGTKGGSLTIEGCVFDGSMTGSSNTRCAGIAGYEYTATTTTITNTLFRPATLTVSTTDDGYTKTFSRDADAIITNSYYTQPLGAAQGTEATASATAPVNLGALLHDYGFMNAYQHGILFDGLYYVDPNAPAFQLLKAATSGDIGKVVCAAGHLHPAKAAVPDGCTAVGILGKVTGYGQGLILALHDATSQNWNTINGWTSVTAYAGTTLKLLPDGTRGSLTSITSLGNVAVSNWCVAQKDDYSDIFQNLGSAHNDGGYTYDANVNAYLTTDVGGTAMVDFYMNGGFYWSATECDYYGWGFQNLFWHYIDKTNDGSVRPVLGFTFIANELPGTGTAGDPYTISNSDEWQSLASHVNNGNNFSGKYVKLTSDISVTTPVGYRVSDSDNKPFSGTFLGGGNTITVTLDDDGNQGLAPFCYINGATIKDLKVAGTIASSQYHTSGLVGFANGTNLIENCIVTATLNITSNYAGGIIGHGLNSNTTIRGCAFTGTINGVDVERENIGGIWGWSNSGTPTLLNCLENGTYTNIASMHPMGLQKAAGTITNCYYMNPQVGSPQNACTVSGAKQAYTAATAPANRGKLVQAYGMVKAYQNGILYDGKYYVAPASISLANAADNSTTISNANGYVANVTLAARTLYKDGAWNTLCLPFDVTIAGSPLAGATARALESASISGSTLNLTFGDAVDELVAGTPYIIKWPTNSNSPVTCTYTATSGTGTGDGGYDKLVDGNTDTKWCTNGPWTCEFNTSDPVDVTGYTLTTGGDTETYKDRNPLKWTLEAKAKESDEWTVIDSRDVTTNSGDALPETNTAESQVYAIAGDKQGVYQYFRFTVTQAGGTLMQLSELTLQQGHLVSPVFSGVTIDATDRSYDNSASGDNRVRFLGTYKSTAFDAEDKSILLMGGGNALYYPTAGAGIGAQRAYFKIGSEGALLARRLTAFNIDFGDDETTGIITIEHGTLNIEHSADAWFTLDGRRLSAKPSRAGVYINNGIKVVIK